ncbi:MAG: hypothetical protein WC087_01400 [Candidatus Paceibacterota bacterium]
MNRITHILTAFLAIFGLGKITEKNNELSTVEHEVPTEEVQTPGVNRVIAAGEKKVLYRSGRTGKRIVAKIVDRKGTDFRVRQLGGRIEFTVVG